MAGAQSIDNFYMDNAITKAASYTGSKFNIFGAKELIFTWDITAAERDSGNETYDLYITTYDNFGAWDIAHFSQVLSTGAKRFVAIVKCGPSIVPQEITTATPGVSANMSGTLKVDTAGSNEGTTTLAAGKVRHGALGERIGSELVIAGTVVTGISYSLTCVAKY